jgi:hypothetical protein
MILPNMILPWKANITELYDYNTPDNPKDCVNKKWFDEYPYEIQYTYNSRGFRDKEWPSQIEELKGSVWCIGDSATTGIGVPQDQMWTTILSKKIQSRIINIGMTGASNDWIHRKSMEVMNEISPKILIIQWSYLESYELNVEEELTRRFSMFYNSIKDDSWPDCPTFSDYHTLPEYIRIECETAHTIDPGLDWRVTFNEHDVKRFCSSDTYEEDVMRTIRYIKSLSEYATKESRIIHIHPAKFINKKSEKLFTREISNISCETIPKMETIDWARDYYHYGLLSAQKFVDDIVQKIG